MSHTVILLGRMMEYSRSNMDNKSLFWCLLSVKDRTYLDSAVDFEKVCRVLHEVIWRAIMKKALL